MKLIFASSNAHKTAEIQSKLNGRFQIVNLKDLGFTDDIPETAKDLEGNATIKAQFCASKFGVDCFADDTGLEIEALNGEPGVYSARYAGEHRSNSDNMDLVLEKLSSQTNRAACFRTVITLIYKGKEYCFEGRVDGHIQTEKKGEAGFGYDPIFVPEGFDKSFAEMTQAEKNSMSHRARAIEKMVKFLNESLL